MDVSSKMAMLKAIRSARPDLFPLDADLIDSIQNKALSAPQKLNGEELFLLSVATLEQTLWEYYNDADPDNGDEQFYTDLMQ